MKAFAILSVLTVAHLARADASGFCYNKTRNCFPWHDGVCASGKNQSPVDIKLGVESVLKYAVFDIEFSPEYKTDLQNVLVENNGHTVQYSLNSGATSNLKLNLTVHDVKHEYTFGQAHVHRKSEHTLSGIPLDVELHLVHYRAPFNSITEAAASGESDALMVLGLFFQGNGTLDSKSFEPFVNNLVEEPKKTKTCSESINLHELFLSASRPCYFTGQPTLDVVSYDGSLTTPGCNEIVRWLVVLKPLVISERQLKAFDKVQDAEKEQLHNNRPAQELNGRLLRLAAVTEKPTQPLLVLWSEIVGVLRRLVLSSS